MRIARAQIQNYKGFRSSPKMNFTTGFNVIVGQNDAGKTAMLEALGLQFGDQPHQSLSVTPTGISRITITVTFTPEETKDILRRSRVVMIDFLRDGEAEAEQTFYSLLEGELNLDCVVLSGTIQSATLREYAPKGDIQGVLIFQWDNTTESLVRFRGFGSGSRLTEILTAAVRERVYGFRAERLHIGTSRFGDTKVLSPDARNLAEVLANLQSTPRRFERFNQFVTTIFPSVRWVSVRAEGKENVQIYVWSVDPSTEREDLAIRLNDSGTGIGQVLAILYVAVTSSYPQTILIDEPQSFLHPGAVRKLIRILKLHSQHQFIITTHAPYAITEADPGAVFLVRKERMESVVHALDARVADDLKALLSEMGVRISDVFGAENILWVEGATEEICFPKLMSQVNQGSRFGTTIIGVANTGDFETPRKLNAFSVYERLSSTGGLLPQAIGFIFDREDRSDSDRNELIRRSRGKVKFLHRRLYENYLLHPTAIAQVISAMEAFPGEHSPEEIDAWITAHRWEDRFFKRAPAEEHRSEELWLELGHGANLLHALFAALSDHTVEYRKTEHGPLLTDWIIKHDPEHFRELVDLLSEILAEN